MVKSCYEMAFTENEGKLGLFKILKKFEYTEKIEISQTDEDDNKYNK